MVSDDQYEDEDEDEVVWGPAVAVRYVCKCQWSLVRQYPETNIDEVEAHLRDHFERVHGLTDEALIRSWLGG